MTPGRRPAKHNMKRDPADCSKSGVMTNTELCAYLSICRSTVYRLIKVGKLPFFKLGRAYRFNREEIDQWTLGRTDIRARRR
jgi:excisionase family DNA binding protein